MSDRNELFPFPEQSDGESGHSDIAAKKSLPSFPGSESSSKSELSTEEILELRKIMQLFRENSSDKILSSFTSENEDEENDQEEIEPPILPAFNESLTNLTDSSFDFQKEAIQLIKSSSSREELDKTTFDNLISILEEINDKSLFLHLFTAISGSFPIKQCLRNGTPEQKIFALSAIGDRFFQSISGLVFPQRKRLIKAIGKYFTEVSVSFSFIQMEGENFNPQYHERVPGSSATGRVIKEMRGFLVVGKENSQITRISPVLT